MFEEEELTYAEHLGKRKQTAILVSGYKRSGKDFVASYLEQKLRGSKRYSFAEPLKDIVATTLGITYEQLEEFKNYPDDYPLQTVNDSEYIATDYRAVLQIFGTEAMKKWFGEAVWVDTFINQKYEEGILILSDWRFNIEVEGVKKVYDKVITIRVVDDNIVNTDLHSSETELDNYPFDIILNNTAKDSSIYEIVDQIVAPLQRKKICT